MNERLIYKIKYYLILFNFNYQKVVYFIYIQMHNLLRFIH